MTPPPTPTVPTGGLTTRATGTAGRTRARWRRAVAGALMAGSLAVTTACGVNAASDTGTGSSAATTSGSGSAGSSASTSTGGSTQLGQGSTTTTHATSQGS